MKKLIVMCGCPASGKSTWVKEELQRTNKTTLVVSRDFIRFTLLKPEDEYFAREREVFRRFCEDISNGLADNETEVVIADATHISKKSRRYLLENITIPSDCIIEAVCLEAPIEVCLDRNEQRTGRTRVPEEALCNMYENYTRPSLNEGFDCIRIFVETSKIKYKITSSRSKKNERN